MSSLPRVTVLLATRNGRDFLPEQLDSILAQRGVQVRVVVSDDASDDGTVDYLTARADADPRVELLPATGPSGGAAQNFYRLLREADLGDGPVALSDQDDVWHLDKLRREMDAVAEGADGVSSDVTAFWPDGRRRLVRKSWPQRRWDFLFEGPGPGSTFLLTARLARLLRELLDDPSSRAGSLTYHDWLVYAVCRSRGWRWTILDEPTVDYRQHAANAMGANAGVRSKAHRLGLIAQKWHRREASALAGVGLEVAPEQRRTELECMKALLDDTGPRARAALVRQAGELRRRPRDRVLLGALVAGGIW